MDTIERELLYRIVTDRPFAEYITQRIDIGDFDDEVANRIYDEIVELLCMGKQMSYKTLFEYFSRDKLVIGAMKSLDK